MARMTRTEELRLRLLGKGYDGGSPADRLWGWLGPLLMAAIGGGIRFWSLGRPDQLVFDETYYVKQGVSLLDHGVELRVRDGLETPDELFTNGTTDVWGTTGDMVVHPPVGKWVIAAGEWLFGPTSSFGWRFGVAVLGTLSILVVGRVARRLFRSTLLGTIAAFLLAFEGHHFVHSRTGLLDLTVMFFTLTGFAALLIDRDAANDVSSARTVLEEKDCRGPSVGGGFLLSDIDPGVSCVGRVHRHRAVTTRERFLGSRIVAGAQ